MREIDARGKPCPQPVLLTKEAVDAGEEVFAVLVDNRPAVENVRRYGEKSGYSVTVTEAAGFWRLELRKAGAAPATPAAPAAAVSCCLPGDQAAGPERQVRTLVIQGEEIGHGDGVLGRRLLQIFLETLAASEVQPERIILLNAGVKLACEGSPVLGALQDLEKKGVTILACGTCLNHFNLSHALQVGRETNAYEVLKILFAGGALTWG